MLLEQKYDVVLSFAGEDRLVVERVRDHLKFFGLKVFYDFDEQHDLLGKDLAEHFSTLYQRAAGLCVVFVSRHYVAKPWCRWERRAALARTFESQAEYLIPYIIEEASVPGIPQTIGRAYMQSTPPWEFAQLVYRKLRGHGVPGLAGDDSEMAVRLAKAWSPSSARLRIRNPSRLTRLATQFQSLDSLLQKRLVPGAIYGICDRPFVGRQALALNMAARMATRGIPVLYATLRSPALSVAQMILALRAGAIPSSAAQKRLAFHTESASDLVSDDNNTTQSLRLAMAFDALLPLPITIIDPGDRCQLDNIICEMWKGSDGDAGVFFFDALSEVNDDGFFGQSLRIGTRSTIDALSWLARETRMAGFVLMDLNQSLEQRVDKSPTLQDIRGGKRVYQKCDTMFLVHRPEVYDPPESDSTNVVSDFLVYSGTSDDGKRRGPKTIMLRKDFGTLIDYWDTDWGYDGWGGSPIIS